MDVIKYFNMFNDGDSAVVRILHSSTNTIEKSAVHTIPINGKNSVVKCCGDGCPMCSHNVRRDERVYIHLYDYTDNTEKVWSRTDRILPQLEEVVQSWGNMINVPVKITRHGKEFPKYDVSVLPPDKYTMPAGVTVDEKVAYRFYRSRSVDEMNEFYRTGVLPDHKSTYVPKEEYFKSKQGNNNVATADTVTHAASNSTAAPTVAPVVADMNTPVFDDDLPF